jgi:ATP-binding protein involved in chromosome partitioning
MRKNMIEEKTIEQAKKKADNEGDARFKAQQEKDQKLINKKMDNVRYVIVVLSGKGGVGKTTVAINLATALALNALQVGVLDADITGPNTPKMLGIKQFLPTKGESGIQPALGPLNMKVMSMAFLLADPDMPVIWRGPLKGIAIKQFIMDVNWGELDYLVVDLPPGTGDEPLSILQLIPNISGVVIVTTPQDVALLDVRKSIKMVQELKKPILGIVENMSGFICPHCGHETRIFGEGGGRKAAEDMKIPFLGSIPIDANITKDGDKGLPFIVQNTRSEAALAFNAATRKVRMQIESDYEG